jgi:CRISPR-associated protein Cmr2
MSNKYIAITIGPIQETLETAERPAALWLASFLFSHISQKLCERIAAAVGEENIVSPWYAQDDPDGDTTNGIGMFHDRIIARRTDDLDMDKIQEIIGSVKKEVAQAFSGSDGSAYTANWFSRYMQIHAVEFEGKENLFAESAPILDALELEKNFVPVTQHNPLNEAVKDNESIKKIAGKFGVKIREKWQLTSADGSDLRDLGDISGKPLKSGMKKHSYFAVIQSDGDNMSKYAPVLGSDIVRDEFSRALHCFSQAAAEIVGKFGGVTIYAGGDDLLCIVPVESPNEGQGTVVDLLSRIQKDFQSLLGTEHGSPTLSFGVAISYYKHPLYEAFQEAGDMLFAHAKQGEKNAAAFSLLKHSGQNARFAISHFDSNPCIGMLSDLIEANLVTEDYLNSASKKIFEFLPLFAFALSQSYNADDPALVNVFNNTFDSGVHSSVGFGKQSEKIRNLLFASGGSVSAIDLPAGTTAKDARLYALDAMLRFVKFFKEKREESDNE